VACRGWESPGPGFAEWRSPLRGVGAGSSESGQGREACRRRPSGPKPCSPVGPPYSAVAGGEGRCRGSAARQGRPGGQWLRHGQWRSRARQASHAPLPRGCMPRLAPARCRRWAPRRYRYPWNRDGWDCGRRDCDPPNRDPCLGNRDRDRWRSTGVRPRERHASPGPILAQRPLSGLFARRDPARATVAFRG
jgi:hypothetical protein